MAYKINSTPNAPHSITGIFHAELLFVEYLYETLEKVASVKRLAIFTQVPYYSVALCILSCFDFGLLHSHHDRKGND